MSRRRRLSDEDQALWDRVADKTEPLDPKRPKPVVRPKMAKPGINARNPDSVPLPAFRVSEKAAPRGPGHDLQKPLRERLSGQPVAMDRKAHKRMKRGKLTPEAQIDLHGMTLARAHPALIRFILLARASGKRLVLVITGKGRDKPDEGPMPTPRGVLRHQVPHWLTIPPLAEAVLEISESHISHGGVGAYYVYLRRTR